MASHKFRNPMVVAALVTYLLQYAILFHFFIFKYVDSDQLIQADMALNYAKGNVPEPYFWGQNYNFPVESWLATPLVMGGQERMLPLSQFPPCYFTCHFY
jgi:hypothetical protein